LDFWFTKKDARHQECHFFVFTAKGHANKRLEKLLAVMFALSVHAFVNSIVTGVAFLKRQVGWTRYEHLMVSLESRSGPYWNSLYAQATSEPSK
jgi:uncharacterized membrane protein YciS (DUF1049 family)